MKTTLLFCAVWLYAADVPTAESQSAYWKARSAYAEAIVEWTRLRANGGPDSAWNTADEKRQSALKELGEAFQKISKSCGDGKELDTDLLNKSNIIGCKAAQAPAKTK